MRKKILKSILSEEDKRKIQTEIRKANLIYDLESLPDKIGNIVCKFPVEILKHRPTKLSPERGIAGYFESEKWCSKEIKCYYHELIMDDHMIIDDRIIPFELTKEKPRFEYELKPNRYRNIITVADRDNDIIYYSADRDYSFGSDYYAVVTPPNYVIQLPSNRKIYKDGKEDIIEVTDISGIGEFYIQKEVYETDLRHKEWKDKQIVNHHYFNAFEKGDEELAFKNIKAIVNDRDLLWDLKEIWLVDPYLKPEDILKSVVYCQKRGILIKCLTSLGTIKHNKETKEEKLSGENSFDGMKGLYFNCLKMAIPEDSDLRIEYRTVFGEHGQAFHDRYLIMKYNINKCRAWSLGISVNSLGKSHHIIQIVEAPTSVANIIEKIWDETDVPECLIYKNT